MPEKYCFWGWESLFFQEPWISPNMHALYACNISSCIKNLLESPQMASYNFRNLLEKHAKFSSNLLKSPQIWIRKKCGNPETSYVPPVSALTPPPVLSATYTNVHKLACTKKETTK